MKCKQGLYASFVLSHILTGKQSTAKESKCWGLEAQGLGFGDQVDLSQTYILYNIKDFKMWCYKKLSLHSPSTSRLLPSLNEKKKRKKGWFGLVASWSNSLLTL